MFKKKKPESETPPPPVARTCAHCGNTTTEPVCPVDGNPLKAPAHV